MEHHDICSLRGSRHPVTSNIFDSIQVGATVPDHVPTEAMHDGVEGTPIIVLQWQEHYHRAFSGKKERLLPALSHWQTSEFSCCKFDT